MRGGGHEQRLRSAAALSPRREPRPRRGSSGGSAPALPPPLRRHRRSRAGPGGRNGAAAAPPDPHGPRGPRCLGAAAPGPSRCSSRPKVSRRKGVSRGRPRDAQLGGGCWSCAAAAPRAASARRIPPCWGKGRLRGRSPESLLQRGQTPISSSPSPSAPVAKRRRDGDLNCCGVALRCGVNLRGSVAAEVKRSDFNICMLPWVKERSPLVFRSCNTWRGRGCCSISFPSSFGRSGVVLGAFPAAFSRVPQPFRHRGSPAEGRLEAPCLAAAKLRGGTFSGSESPGRKLWEWDYGRNQRGNPGARLLVGDVTLLPAFYTPQ